MLQRTSTQPAPTSRSMVCCSSPRLKGPWSSGMGVKTARRRSRTEVRRLYGSAKYGARSRCGQTEATSRPPGLQAALRRRNARSGSEKNMIPNREMIASNASSGKSYSTASATTQSILGAADRSRPASIISGEMSMPQTHPSGPTRSAASIVVAPAPQPTSSTRSPGFKSTTEKIASATGIRGASITARCDSQNRARSAFHPYVCSTSATAAPAFLGGDRFRQRFGKFTGQVVLEDRSDGRRHVGGTRRDQRWQLEDIPADEHAEHLGGHQTRTPGGLGVRYFHGSQYPTDHFEGEELTDR